MPTLYYGCLLGGGGAKKWPKMGLRNMWPVPDVYCQVYKKKTQICHSKITKLGAEAVTWWT